MALAAEGSSVVQSMQPESSDSQVGSDVAFQHRLLIERNRQAPVDVAQALLEGEELLRGLLESA